MIDAIVAWLTIWYALTIVYYWAVLTWSMVREDRKHDLTRKEYVSDLWWCLQVAVVWPASVYMGWREERKHRGRQT